MLYKITKIKMVWQEHLRVHKLASHWYYDIDVPNDIKGQLNLQMSLNYYGYTANRIVHLLLLAKLMYNKNSFFYTKRNFTLNTLALCTAIPISLISIDWVLRTQLFITCEQLHIAHGAQIDDLQDDYLSNKTEKELHRDSVLATMSARGKDVVSFKATVDSRKTGRNNQTCKMADNSFIKTFKKLDFYRKLPQDLTESSMTGGIVSIIVLLLVALLFLSEFVAYMTVKTTSKMYVDNSHYDDQIIINIDITFPRLPCQAFTLNAQDVSGIQNLKLGGTLTRRRVLASGEEQEQEDLLEFISSKKMPSALTIKQQAEAKEGCRVVGALEVLKAPGNIHFTSERFRGTISEAIGRQKLDYSHIIHQFTFGNKKHHKFILKKGFDEGVLSPLDGKEFSKPPIGQTSHNFEYYIKVVPTTYKTIKNKTRSLYQFTANTNSYTTEAQSTLYFRYEISQISVLYKQVQTTFLHFLVQLCAIVGGAFTLVGLIQSLTHENLSKLLKVSDAKGDITNQFQVI